MSLAHRFMVSLAWTLALLAATPSPARADPTVAQAEIAQLRDFVRASACRFVRNGTEYAATQALGHMDMKAERIGRRIQTAEHWIEFVATRSSQSGKAYRIRCAGEPERDAGAWLRAELDRMRANRPDASPG